MGVSGGPEAAAAAAEHPESCSMTWISSLCYFFDSGNSYKT